MQVTLVTKSNIIVITTRVYDYSDKEKENSEYAYLEYCKFKASVNNKKYFKLMEIQTPQQDKSNFTDIIFKNKRKRASIKIANEYFTMPTGMQWPDHLWKCMTVKVSNKEDMSAVVFKWILGSEFKDVRYIRISGRWHGIGRSVERFRKIVYDLNQQNQKPLKSSTPDTITKETENDAVNILKDSEAIIIKGADPGANIKVYSKSGVEIKSVISDNDVVNIKLPANQIYIVHIGKSRFKVAL